MPHPTKKQRLEGNRTTVDAADNDFLASLDDLSVDVLANILGFFPPIENMLLRRINKKSKEAVRKAIIPPTKVIVDSFKDAYTMRVMAEAMPNLQRIDLHSLNAYYHKWSDGEDPYLKEAARTADHTAHDIEIISNFSKLKILKIGGTELNGRYPILFNSFPLLQKLTIQHGRCLKWDLEMLAGFPSLKELYCLSNSRLAGNINSLSVLNETLESVTIRYCVNVKGNFMDLADFPHLKELDLYETAVTGDIRDIGENDFSSLEEVDLPKGVYGGMGCELQRISDAHNLVRSVYLLKKHRPALNMRNWYGVLSRDSIDWYGKAYIILFVQAGSRIGYQWDDGGSPCEVNWLDPEPDSESSDYSKYIEELERFESQVGFYRGFHQPPTEEEYNRRMEEWPLIANGILH
jgi:hypothetical protein